MSKRRGPPRFVLDVPHFVAVGQWIQMPARERWSFLGFKIAVQRRRPWILIWRHKPPMQSFKIVELRNSTTLVVSK